MPPASAALDTPIVIMRIRNPLFVERTLAYVLASQPFASTNVGTQLLATWRRAPLSFTANYGFVNAREFEDPVFADVPVNHGQPGSSCFDRH